MGAAASLAVALAGLLIAQEAADQSPFGKNIVEVRVTGNQKVSEHLILGQVKTRVGQPYDRDAIQQDVLNIYSLGRFLSVKPETQVAAQGVFLTFAVVERPQIESVDYVGAKGVKFDDLSAEAGFTVGDFLDPGQLNLARQKLLDLYRRKGYYFASISVNSDALQTRRVVFQIVEGPEVRVRKIVFEGSEHFTDAQLSRQIETKKYLWIFSPGLLDDAQVKEDAVRLAKFYRDEGFLDARVSVAPPRIENQTDAAITFVIEEGPRYTINAVRFDGNKHKSAAELRAQMLLQPGQYFTAAARTHDIEALRDRAYGASGYIDAQVEIRDSYADEPGRVNLDVRIDEGAEITVGRINIVGNSVTHRNVILHHLTFFPEQPYNVLQERESLRRLKESQLFSQVEIVPEEAEGNQRDVLVRVEEGRTRNFLIGVGISSDSGLLGNLTLENRNFDLFGAWPRDFKELFSSKAFSGAGQTLRIVAEPGTELNRFQVQFYEPFLMDQPVSLGTNLYFFTRPRDGFDESRVGYSMAFGRRLPRNWSIEGAFRIEGIDISGADSDAPKDITDAEGAHALFAPKVTAVRDTTDSLFLPTQGQRLSLSAEPAIGSDNFARFIADWRGYQTVRTDVFDRKTVVNARLTAGYIAGDAPVFERFFAGGINSLRGFKFRTVSPHDGPDGDPIGGHFELLASLEYAFPLVGKSQGVFFVDAGTVESNLTVSTIRAAVGFEVRIPIEFFNSIPLTFGVAAPVAKDADDDTQWFHFLFGTSF